jgi:hypothetical protein
MPKIKNFKDSVSRLIEAVNNFSLSNERQGLGSGLVQLIHAQFGYLVHLVQKVNPDWPDLQTQLRAETGKIDHACMLLGDYFRTPSPTPENRLLAGICANFLYHFGNLFVEKWQPTIPDEYFSE